jgi:octanoyl-[GcvH]:protein N-octanoyltransferase
MNLFRLFKHVTLIDESVSLENQLSYDKDLSKLIHKDGFIVRFWSTEGIILGKMDTLLPQFEKGLKHISGLKINTLIRKAGGLAVVCDKGILNLSILFSKDHPEIGGLNESYDFAVNLLKHLLQDYHLIIEEGEISNSYCPGKYDLSVRGKKFAGMAQYRSKEAVMVMITLCVSGNQANRCELIRDFYSLANPLMDPKYPEIDLNSMITLSELTNKPVTVHALKENMTLVLRKSGIIVNHKKHM